MRDGKLPRELSPRIGYPAIQCAFYPVSLPLVSEAVPVVTPANRSALGRQAESGRLCDANIMVGEGETTAIFGPWDLAFGAHGTDGFVPVYWVVDACKVCAHLTVHWRGVAPSAQR
ncbi:MAG: hypothetical protein ACLGIS_04940 [Actinomycetes bacterium]